MSKSSNNTTLVPNANIVLGGSGANRTVTVTPAANQTGSATITITVSDGTNSASDSFVLTVNTPPTISDIPNQTINGEHLDWCHCVHRGRRRNGAGESDGEREFE